MKKRSVQESAMVRQRRNNPNYRPEPAKEVVINGRKCLQLDASRIADAAIMAGEGLKP